VFLERFRRTEAKVARVFGTASEIIMLQGEAVLGLEAAARALVRPGLPVLNLVSGVFGYGMSSWLKRLGAQLHELSVPYDEVIDPGDVEAYLDAHPEIELLCVVHCETPSGTLTDCSRIGPIARGHSHDTRRRDHQGRRAAQDSGDRGPLHPAHPRQRAPRHRGPAVAAVVCVQRELLLHRPRVVRRPARPEPVLGHRGHRRRVGGQSLQEAIPGLPVEAWIAIFAVPAVALAVWGYRLIHAVQPYLVVIMTGVWLAMVGLLIASGDHLAKGMGGLHLTSFPIFLVVVRLFFMNQLSWAIYVSDDSRYMPAYTSGPRIFTAVAVGSTVSTVAFCALGAWVAAIAPGLSRLGRVVGVVVISAIALVLALLGWKSFVNSFSNFLDVLLFVFVPWSLINLVDFYLVRRERYDVASFYTPRGVYGGWRWVAVIPYLVAVGVEFLFVDQTDIKGPLGGADISWIVGGVVAAVGYLIAVRIVGPGGAAPAPQPASVTSRPLC
jgi:hypothetical protein